jgi:hypothetical protein
LGAGAGLLVLAAIAMLLMPKNAATTTAADILLMALNKAGIVIGSSFPYGRAPLTKRSPAVQTEQRERVTQHC